MTEPILYLRLTAQMQTSLATQVETASFQYENWRFCNYLRQDFHELYELMNGMPLREMDQIVYPVCTLCRDHERSGFIHGVQVGIRLAEELK